MDTLKMIPPELLEQYAAEFLHMLNNPRARDLCESQELTDMIEIGASTCFRFQVKLHPKLVRNRAEVLGNYSVAAMLLPMEIIYTRAQYGQLSIRIEESNGYVLKTNLKHQDVHSQQLDNLFGKNVKKDKLKGKFQIEALFVDEQRIGNDTLFQKYVANINARFENQDDETTLKEKVRKAEKWLASARKKMGISAPSILDPAPEPKDKSRVGRLDVKSAGRFPQNGLCNHMYAERFFGIFSEEACRPQTIRAAIYADSADAFNHSYTKLNREEISRYAHTLYEFRTHDGHLVSTKLRPHSKNTIERIAADVQEHRLRNYSLSAMFIVTVFYIEIPAFASSKTAEALLTFVRKTLENEKDEYPRLNLKECTELLDKKCDCNKLHLLDYCTMEILDEKKYRNIDKRSWRIKPTNLRIKLFSALKLEADYYVALVNRLCRSTFAGTFGVGTNFQIEIEENGKKYSTALKHHSEFVLEHLPTELKAIELLALHKEFVVTLYVVHILKFASNEEVHMCLGVMKGTHNEEDVRKASMMTKRMVIHEQPKLVKEAHRKKVASLDIPSTTSKHTFTLHSSCFKAGSNLETKASTMSVNIQEGYKIHSSKIKMNTTKSRILLFSIESNNEFFNNVLDSSLLVANICLDLVKSNEISLWTDKKKKITMKLSYARTIIQVILNEKDCSNPNKLKEDVFRGPTATICPVSTRSTVSSTMKN